MSRSLNPQLFGQIDTPIVKVDAGALQNRKLGELEAQLEIANQKIDRLAQLMDQRIQHLQNGQKTIEQQIKQTSENFSSQQAAILSKFNERRGADAKIQELVDRHNQLVHNFEMKISQLQKVATEQGLKLSTYQATYDEVLREIRALGRSSGLK